MPVMGAPRSVEALSRSSWDLVIVGGGVYGVAAALEAARRGLRPLLLERGDFGGETTWNSLRIVHGGFRYLQTLDLKRFRESVAERQREMLQLSLRVLEANALTSRSMTSARFQARRGSPSRPMGVASRIS